MTSALNTNLKTWAMLWCTAKKKNVLDVLPACKHGLYANILFFIDSKQIQKK